MNYVNTTFSIDGIIEYCQAYQLGTGGFAQKGRVVTRQGLNIAKPTSWALEGLHPNTTQWGAWPQDYSVVKPGKQLAIKISVLGVG